MAQRSESKTRSGMQPTSVKFEPGLYLALKIWCVKNRRTITDVINELVRDFLIEQGEEIDENA